MRDVADIAAIVACFQYWSWIATQKTACVKYAVLVSHIIRYEAFPQLVSPETNASIRLEKLELIPR